MTKAVLELLKKMLEFGFYRQSSDLFRVTQELLKQINSTFDVTTELEEEYLRKALEAAEKLYP